VECNLGFKIGQDDHSCKGAIGTETWTGGMGEKYGRLNVSMEDESGFLFLYMLVLF
jgi:hypothetical protein